MRSAGRRLLIPGLVYSGNNAIQHLSSANCTKYLRFTFIIVINTLDLFRAVVQTTIIVLDPVIQLLLPCLRTSKLTVLRTSFRLMEQGHISQF
jgi:hypothetical protein